SGSTRDVLGVEPVPEKLRAFGFAAQRVNGNDVREILGALDTARATREKPFALVADTRLFHGTPSLMRKYPKAHFLRAPAQEIDLALAELGA
ncbi:MAG TPA: transketolase, partial [Burkholderiales bacterium]|nr:transketolase [Burkholderiales bacterium]